MLSAKACLIGLVFVISATSVGSTPGGPDDGFENFLNALERYESTPNDVVFLLEESGYISDWGIDQLKRLTKLILRKLSISEWQSRVAVVTFSAKAKVRANYIKEPDGNNVCNLLKVIDAITFDGEYRRTARAMQTAQEILDEARPDSEKIVFLVTNGLSNPSFSPVPRSEALKSEGVAIFAVGIEIDNLSEIEEVATSADHTYVLQEPDGIPDVDDQPLDGIVDDSLDLIKNSSFCDQQCDEHASCYCGSRTGTSHCICKAGYFDDDEDTGGLKECLKCPRGTYKAEPKRRSCTPCPPLTTTIEEGSTSPADCVCPIGYEKIGSSCSMCPEGTYKDAFGNDNCLKCPRNSITLRRGTTRISDCLCTLGFEKNGNICLPCPEGSYKDNSSKMKCLKCPPNSTTLRTGSTKASDCVCEAGFRKTGNTCSRILREENQTELPLVLRHPSIRGGDCECTTALSATVDSSSGDEVDASLPLLGKLIKTLPRDRRLPKIMELLNNVHNSVESNKRK